MKKGSPEASDLTRRGWEKRRQNMRERGWLPKDERPKPRPRPVKRPAWSAPGSDFASHRPGPDVFAKSERDAELHAKGDLHIVADCRMRAGGVAPAVAVARDDTVDLIIAGTDEYAEWWTLCTCGMLFEERSIAATAAAFNAHGFAARAAVRERSGPVEIIVEAE